MATCLGIYIQENMIKYAKVTKERENITVDSFGVKFYEDIEKTIEQIVQETYCYKTPISINLSEEMYQYFDMFALLNKKDLQKAIKTEFDLYCNEKGYTPSLLESRYVAVNNVMEKEKLKIIHISANKQELNKRMEYFEEYKLTNVTPISMAIPNIIELEKGENAIVVNIGDHTTITTIIDEKIYEVTELEEGALEILRKINAKENSYTKSYEICKNTTIYTAEGQGLGEDTAGHLEDIMPTLYNIVGQVRKIINGTLTKIDKVYITGTASCINNVDLYFQEYLTEIKCEILKPYFVKNVKEISIKDYIEVNSAIALAMQGLEQGIEGINFKRASIKDKLPELKKKDAKQPNEGKKEGKLKIPNFKFDLSGKLDAIEKSLIRSAVGILTIIIAYTSFSTMIVNEIEEKKKEATQSIEQTNKQISLINSDTQKVRTRKSEYTTKIQNLQALNDKISEANKIKNTIPNLLNSIMFSIPKEVQITSIENTTNRHIVINAKAQQYEQLGFLIAIIKNNEYLTNVISSSGVKEGNEIKVTIEGELP